jgi:hypothetical protein
MQPSDFPLGMVVAERKMTLFDPAGQERRITIRLGAPVRVGFPGDPKLAPTAQENEITTCRCPVQIEGLDHDEKVFAPFGEDPFVALQYAIDFIGDLLQGGGERLGLVNRNRVDSHTRNHWIWQYPNR